MIRKKYHYSAAKLSALFVAALTISAMPATFSAHAQDASWEYRDAKASSPNDVQGNSTVRAADDASSSDNMRDDEGLANAQPADSGKVSYTSGGVADSGMEAVDTSEKGYNLKMLFVSNGQYLANVGVKIFDAKGNGILETTSNGPVLLVKMPSGRYTVSTQTEGGNKLTRHVTVSANHLTAYVMRYPETQNN